MKTCWDRYKGRAFQIDQETYDDIEKLAMEIMYSTSTIISISAEDLIGYCTGPTRPIEDYQLLLAEEILEYATKEERSELESLFTVMELTGNADKIPLIDIFRFLAEADKKDDPSSRLRRETFYLWLRSAHLKRALNTPSIPE